MLVIVISIKYPPCSYSYCIKTEGRPLASTYDSWKKCPNDWPASPASPATRVTVQCSGDSAAAGVAALLGLPGIIAAIIGLSSAISGRMKCLQSAEQRLSREITREQNIRHHLHTSLGYNTFSLRNQHQRAQQSVMVQMSVWSDLLICSHQGVKCFTGFFSCSSQPSGPRTTSPHCTECSQYHLFEYLLSRRGRLNNCFDTFFIAAVLCEEVRSIMTASRSTSLIYFSSRQMWRRQIIFLVFTVCGSST